MATIRERCKHCGTLLLWQVQLTTDGREEYVKTVPRTCPVRSLAPHAPSHECECETRADRMARDTANRISRKFGVRTKRARMNGRR